MRKAKPRAKPAARNEGAKPSAAPIQLVQPGRLTTPAVSYNFIEAYFAARRMQRSTLLAVVAIVTVVVGALAVLGLQAQRATAGFDAQVVASHTREVAARAAYNTKLGIAGERSIPDYLAMKASSLETIGASDVSPDLLTAFVATAPDAVVVTELAATSASDVAPALGGAATNTTTTTVAGDGSGSELPEASGQVRLVARAVSTSLTAVATWEEVLRVTPGVVESAVAFAGQDPEVDITVTVTIEPNELPGRLAARMPSVLANPGVELE